MTPTMALRSRTLAPVVLPLVLALVAHGCRLVAYQVELASVAVLPGESRIARTTTKQFTATARYTDDSEREVTGEVAWTSSNPAVATVSDGGLATPAQPGTTTITATLHGRSGSTVLTITDAQLQGIDVTPANPSIANGTRVQLTATGHFDDGSSQDLTAAATWSSSGASVTVGNDPGAKGLATSTALGATASTVSAAVGAISGSTTLTVKAVTLQSLSVNPAAATIGVGQVQQFGATGSFSDGTTQGMTGEVTWSSTATSVATVGPTGLATGVFAGSTSIGATSSALLGSVPGTAALTVQTAGGGY